LFQFRRFQLTLPKGNYLPASLLQCSYSFSVVGYVGIYFVQPPVGAGFGYYIIFTSFVAVPEAAVYKDDGLVPGQHYIRLARHILYMQAVPVAVGVQITAHQHLGLGIFPFDAAHVIAARGLVVYVCHWCKVRLSASA
jgi:hypothetical protein